MKDSCKLCGASLREKTRLTGEKQGNRYLVCSNYPDCTYRKSFAEQGFDADFKYHLEGGKFTIKNTI